MSKKKQTHTEKDIYAMKLPRGYETDRPSLSGVLIGVFLIALVLIVGGLYLWGAYLHESEPAIQPRTIPNNEPETVRANTDTEILQTVSSSDDITAIEADLESMNFDGVKADLAAINQEFDQLTE